MKYHILELMSSLYTRTTAPYSYVLMTILNHVKRQTSETAPYTPHPEINWTRNASDLFKSSLSTQEIKSNYLESARYSTQRALMVNMVVNDAHGIFFKAAEITKIKCRKTIMSRRIYQRRG